MCWTLLHSNVIVLAFIKHMQDSQKLCKRGRTTSLDHTTVTDRMQKRSEAQMKSKKVQILELAIL